VGAVLKNVDVAYYWETILLTVEKNNHRKQCHSVVLGNYRVAIQIGIIYLQNVTKVDVHAR
jgi:hypothetical protein